MSSNTKKCPYCAEEINMDAIKCKHCGEFINSEKNEVEVHQTYTKSIAPQSFLTAIFIIVLFIVLSFAEVFISEEDNIYLKLMVVLLIGEIRIWVYLRKYLKNFKAEKAISLVNWNIILTITLGIVFLAMELFPLKEYEDILFLILIFFFIPLIIVYIMAGIALQKIKNDFVGLLKELGMSIAYLLPITILIGFLSGLMDNIALSIVSDSIEAISYIILIMIFVRAQKFVKKDLIKTE